MSAPHSFIAFSIKDAKGKTSVYKLNFPITATFSDPQITPSQWLPF